MSRSGYLIWMRQGVSAMRPPETVSGKILITGIQRRNFIMLCAQAA